MLVATKRALRNGKHISRFGTIFDLVPKGDSSLRSCGTRAGLAHERVEVERKEVPQQDPSPRNENLTDKDDEWTYDAPLATSLKKVKLLSITSCGLTLAGTPLLVTMGQDDAMWYAKASIATTLVAFGTFTTWLLHWFSHPYVHRLVYDPKKDACTVKQLNVFGLSKTSSFLVSDASIPSTGRPFVSFVVGKRCYYIDRNSFGNETLYRRLVQEEEEDRSSVQDSGMPPAS